MTSLSRAAPHADMLTNAAFTIVADSAAFHIATEDLHALVFGPGRFARTAYRVRGRQGHERSLSFAAFADERLIAAVWQTYVHVGALPAILLGPLAVHPDFAGKGYGQALLASALAAARTTPAEAVILIGDAPYYARAGFRPLGHQRIGWPGPVDPARVLAVELVSGAADRLAGPIRVALLPPQDEAPDR